MTSTGCRLRTMSTVRLLVSLLLVFILNCDSHVQGQSDENHVELEESLKKVLDALDSGLDFFDDHKNQLNLDAIIGSRLVEGQLYVLQQHLKSSSNNHNNNHPYYDHYSTEHDQGILPSRDILRRIDEVQSKARRVSDDALPFIAHNQPDYDDRIGPIIQSGFWRHDYASRDLDDSLLVQPRYKGEVMHEADSDKCLTEFFGTGTSTRKCQISRKCWKLMTSPGYRYYSLSHQVFYLQIGEAYGCFRGNFLGVTDSLAAGFCTNILAEAQSIADQDYPHDRRDLFMEQQALCGIMGYRQFFRTEWLQQILDWQWSAQGCWGDHNPAPAAGSTGRVKREEKQLPDGCECHRTAVAIGALVQYVRYLVEALQ